jgi:two-component system sensor kinase FixL
MNAISSESTALLQAVINTSPDAIVTIDGRAIIQSFNPAAEALFGYSQDEVLGQNVKMLMPPHFREQHDNYLAHYRETGETRIIGIGRVVAGQRKDGSTFPIELFVGETRVDGEQVFVGFIRDLTLLQRESRRVQELQSKLFHVSRLGEMGQVASGLAHEVNQPLAAIMNYAQAGRKLAAADESPNSPIPSIFAKIEQQARRAGDIIKRLRGFVERREIERQRADLHVLIEEALALALVGPAGRDVRVQLVLMANPPSVFIDRIQIQQVLVNLVRNAIDAMEGMPRREITIASAPEGANLMRVSVSDTGRGISQTVADRLFDSFVTTKQDGLGVGLSISRTIVEAHGRAIWFESNHPTGVTFHFTLPVIHPG